VVVGGLRPLERSVFDLLLEGGQEFLEQLLVAVEVDDFAGVFVVDYELLFLFGL
jgi:hypothetical protein